MPVEIPPRVGMPYQNESPSIVKLARVAVETRPLAGVTGELRLSVRIELDELGAGSFRMDRQRRRGRGCRGS